MVSFKHTHGERCFVNADVTYLHAGGSKVKVNHGCWLNENTQVAEFSLTTIRHLVIGIVQRQVRVAFTLDDEREQAGDSGITQRSLLTGNYHVTVVLEIMNADETELTTQTHQFKMHIDALNPHSCDIKEV